MKTFLHNFIVSILLYSMHFRGPYRLKRWIRLESIKEKLVKAVESKASDFPDRVLAYISTALGVSSRWFEQADWMRLSFLFYACISKSPIVQLPITRPVSQEKSKEDPWNYDGRMWHIYSHMLATTYGWTLEYISQLHVDEALAKIQEILTDTQLEHEFYYGLSEIAYPYDKNTKKSVFKPMERPAWMRPKIQPIPRFLIPKSAMPVGNIVDAGVLSEEYQPKEIIH